MLCSTPRLALLRRWLAACMAACLLVLPPPVLPQAGGDFGRCVSALRAELKRHPEVRAETFDTYTRGAQDLRADIERFAATQPEFKLFIWDYLMRRVDAQRVAEGREMLARESAALASIHTRHGVDGATAVAVFGIETDYGRVRGRYPVVDATLSRSCLNLASTERKNHFFAALWLLQEGLVKPDEFRGSWAGAFGKTQFMPGTFTRYMDDGDGSGAPDIVNSVPDALATTARYLNGLGWQDGLPWGVEVRAPRAVVEALNAPEGEHGCLVALPVAAKCRTVEQWATFGVRGLDGQALTDFTATWPRWSGNTTAALLAPAGPDGPAWLVTPNYQAIWRYNRADAYGLAIGLLADALRGAPSQRVAWPTDDAGISRAEFRELQSLLLQRGHCGVSVDGSEGPLTSAAVKAEEGRLGLPETGRAGARILRSLKGEAPGGAVVCGPAAAASSAASAPEPAAPVSAPQPAAPASAPEPAPPASAPAVPEPPQVPVGPASAPASEPASAPGPSLPASSARSA